MGVRLSPQAQMQGQLWSSSAEAWAEIQEGDAGWGEPIYDEVLELTGVGKGTKLLDAGCGAGRFLTFASKRGADVNGIDVAGELVSIARRRNPGADITVGEIEAIPYPDGTFDVATAFSSLQFAADPAAAVLELTRVTRASGQVAVVVPGPPETSELTPVMRALGPLMPPPPPGSEPPNPFALSEPQVVEALFEKAGLGARQTGLVDCPIEFTDEDEFMRGIVGAGPTALAAQHSGADIVGKAVLEAGKPFRNASGGYRLENQFLYVIGTK